MPEYPYINYFESKYTSIFDEDTIFIRGNNFNKFMENSIKLTLNISDSSLFFELKILSISDSLIISYLPDLHDQVSPYILTLKIKGIYGNENFEFSNWKCVRECFSQVILDADSSILNEFIPGNFLKVNISPDINRKLFLETLELKRHFGSFYDGNNGAYETGKNIKSGWLRALVDGRKWSNKLYLKVKE